MRQFSIFGPNADGPLTGRITGFEGPVLPPQPFASGWQTPQPAAATPLGHGGTIVRTPLGLDPAVEAQVASQLIDALDNDADSDARNERNQLIAEWDDLNKRVRKFLTVGHELRIADLRAALENVRTHGREALEEWKTCVAAANDARNALNDDLERYTRARAKLKQAQASKPDPDEWPTSEELEEFEGGVARATERADQAKRRHTELKERLDAAQTRAAEARRKLEGLRTQREQLNAQIEGRPNKGPYGLVVPGNSV